MKARAARGFTLLEVMLAFVILAAAMGLLLGMLGGGLRQVAQSGSDTEAALHAQTLLDQLGLDAPLEPGTRTGEFDGGRYAWRMDVQAIADPAPVPPDPNAPAPPAAGGGGAPEVLQVVLEVAWGQGRGARTWRVSTLRVRTPQQLAP